MRKVTALELIAVAAISGACESTAPSEPTSAPETPRLFLSVAPSVATIKGGGFLKLTATIKRADGGQVAATSVTWASSDRSVARVEGGGIVRGLGAGEARITAKWRSMQASARVTVLADEATAPGGNKPAPGP